MGLGQTYRVRLSEQPSTANRVEQVASIEPVEYGRARLRFTGTNVETIVAQSRAERLKEGDHLLVWYENEAPVRFYGPIEPQNFFGTSYSESPATEIPVSEMVRGLQGR